MTIPEREAAMLRRALGGEDFSVIGKALGVSREWVRSVVKKHTGLSAKDLKDARESARRQFKEQRALELGASEPDLSLDDVARLSGLTVTETESVLGPAESARRRRGRKVTTAASRYHALGGLRRVASLPGGTPLSGPFYDTHRGDGLSSPRIIQVFGTWVAACDAAGVAAPNAIRANYTQRWSREDCLHWVYAYLDSTDRPTFTGLGLWLRDKDGAPSSGTVRLRCGKWIPTMRDAYALEEGAALSPLQELGDGPSHDSDESSTPQTDLPHPQADAREDPLPDEEFARSRAGSRQGIQSDVEVRLKVERAAQNRLMALYESQGWEVSDTHVGSPYDALATKDDETLYLEAKGTQSAGQAVLVTRGEVEHARSHPGSCVMGIWSGIVIDANGDVLPCSGDFRTIPFNPDSGDLTVVGYEWSP